MSKAGPPVTELDLLAYADGLLDAERRDQVESYLRDHPEAAARVRADAQRNAAIRAALAGVAAEPVPERLAAVVDSRHPSIMRRAWRGAAAAALVLSAGLAGWLLGQGGAPDRPAMRAFVADSLTMHAGARPAAAPAGPTASVRPLDWLSERIALELRPPDLSAEGLALEGNAVVNVRGRQAVRLVYRDSQDRPVTLLIGPRWIDDAAPPRFAEKGDLTVGYGLSGPLAYALVGRMSRERIAALTDRIRRALREPGERGTPKVKVAPAPAPRQAGTPNPAATAPPVIETVPVPGRPTPVQAN